MAWGGYECGQHQISNLLKAPVFFFFFLLVALLYCAFQVWTFVDNDSVSNIKVWTQLLVCPSNIRVEEKNVQMNQILLSRPISNKLNCGLVENIVLGVVRVAALVSNTANRGRRKPSPANTFGLGRRDGQAEQSTFCSVIGLAICWAPSKSLLPLFLSFHRGCVSLENLTITKAQNNSN